MKARGPWVVVLVVLALRLPFLNQPIQGDDVYYLAGAEHAQIDPLHPTHARYPFLGKVVDMRGHPHPPLNAWFLGLILAAAGDVYEVPFHAAYILFSLIAALSMWSLARRFSPRPLASTLLFLAAPAFVVNGNSLESDLPLLAFWMASAALFTAAVDGRSPGLLSLSAAAMALAAMAAYQSVVLVPVLAVYLWLHARDWRGGWAAVLAPVLALAAWQLFERVSTGAVPGAVLAGFLHNYGFQVLVHKIENAKALTAHAGWLVFPPLIFAAWSRWWPLALAAAAGGFLLDPHPLYWVSFAAGAVLIGAQLRPPLDFLRAWVALFFASALVLFFAGSARYLLPMAAPAALLLTVQLKERPRWLLAGAAVQFALSLALAVVNYQHWDGYRRTARSLAGEARRGRVWINGEWGLRFYLESEGALPLLEGQAVRPGDIVVSSALGYPTPFTTGGGRLAPLLEREIRPPLPLRLIALGSRSGYSTAALGQRPFDISNAPIDRVRADVVAAQEPALSHLAMNAPEAESQIVSGIYKLEENRYRWMAGRGVVLLKKPDRPAPLQAVVYVPPGAPVRRVEIWADGERVASHAVAAPGLCTVESPPLEPGNPSVTVVIAVDTTYSPPGDRRELGVILSAVGFRP